MALRLASADDAGQVDPELIALAETLVARIKSGQVVGFFAILEQHADREVLAGGDCDPDGIAGFAARVLAAVANNA